MSLLPGQAVTAENDNAAFVSRLQDSDTVGKVGLKNTDVASGANIDNAQQAINETFDAVGMIGEGDITRKDYSSNNVVTDGDSHKTAIGKVDAKFNETSGHAHTGAAGDGVPISASDLGNLNYYRAVWQSVNISSLTGGFFDFTTELSGKVSGGDPGTVGIITDSPFNKVALYSSNGDKFTDAQGQVVYGRIVDVGTNQFRINFYTLEVGVETNYSFSTTEDAVVYYLEVYTLGTIPTIQAAPEFGSLDLTADIVDASLTTRGLVSVGLQSFGGEKTFESLNT